MSSRRRTIDLPADPLLTERVGEQLGRHLQRGDTLGLVGPLGAGKTTLVRGLARGLDLDDPDAVSSPTYLLVVEHQGPLPLMHADAYLPEKLASLLEDGGLEYLFDPAKVVAVEWADQIARYLPERVLWAELCLPPGSGRRLELRCDEAGHFPWLADFQAI